MARHPRRHGGPTRDEDLVHDLSRIPSYLARAAILALVVYAVRAQLLRVREHHADAAATPTGADRAQFAAALASLTLAARGVPATASGPKARGVRSPPWLTLHPTAAQRAAVVADPWLLGAPGPASLLAAGLAAGAAHPLLFDTLAGIGVPLLYAGYWSRGVLFGLAGMVAGAEVARTPPRRMPGRGTGSPQRLRSWWEGWQPGSPLSSGLRSRWPSRKVSGRSTSSPSSP